MTTTPTWFCRPAARQWRTPAPATAAPAFHAELPGYRPTELTELPALAAELGVGRVFVKDESTRMGLGAFKVLGASWATARLLTDRGDAGLTDTGGAGLTGTGDAGLVDPGDAGVAGTGDAGLVDPGDAGVAGTGDVGRVTLDGLRRTALAHPVELVTATDGNHGRAVAWMARLLGLEARVFVPRVVSERARAAIVAEGATVIVAGESYDEAVAEAAAYADEPDMGAERNAVRRVGQGQRGAKAGRVLVQDTAWAGYESVPNWIVEGYGTLLAEVDRQFAEYGLAGPDLVSVPVGVGSLAQAVVAHYRRGERGPGGASGMRGALDGLSGVGESVGGAGGARGDRGVAVLAVEPVTAAGVLASLRAEARQSVPTGGTVMAGLNCGTPSSLAWPVLVGGLDAAIAVTDQMATEAGADLGGLGVRSGPSGAASLAGVRAALTGAGKEARRAELGVTSSSVVLLLSTEGTAGK